MTDTTLAEKGQVTLSAAEIYDSRFVPSLFGQFAPLLVTFAGVAKGDRVLDAATGTGVVALSAAEAGARVTGLDINTGMLAVAGRKSGTVDFVEGDVAALPFDDGSFDMVTCQFGFMFFPDRARALSEMLRVLRPGGTLSVAVFDRLDASPGYSDLVPMLERIVGKAAADALRAPFILGDAEAFATEIREAGGRNGRHQKVTGVARHASLDAWLDTEVGGWTIADMVSGDQLSQLKIEAKQTFAGFVAPDGSVGFPAPAHFFRAEK